MTNDNPPVAAAPVAADSRRFLFALLILSFTFFGCGAARMQLMTEVRNDLRGANTQKAYETYKKQAGKKERVDELLNLGLLALESGDYDKALASFKEADRLAEERLTKSLSREGASLLTNDLQRAYQGTVYDKAILHYYQALAYIGKGEAESAVIEGRRVASYLEVNARESKHTYKDDPFLQWFSAVMYDGFGQTNDAWISYKRALDLYPQYGVGRPDYLCPALMLAAKNSGIPEDNADPDSLCADCEPNRNNLGRIVVFCEAGIAPPILEDNIVFPIMKTDSKDRHGNDDWAEVAPGVYERGRDYEYESSELDYLLHVAIPYYDDAYDGTEVSRVEISGGEQQVRAQLATDCGSILTQDLKDRMPAITIRAITRALIKYAASKAAEEAGKEDSKLLGSILGGIVNAVGAAIEAADTRSWETLPEHIFVADYQLPPGDYDLHANFEDLSGYTLLRHDFPTVHVRAGEITFLRARCWK
ncbi:hypothetical protein IT157_06650 [bacterium]|nr:hypothetical protein [bacterium]